MHYVDAVRFVVTSIIKVISFWADSTTTAYSYKGLEKTYKVSKDHALQYWDFAMEWMGFMASFGVYMELHTIITDNDCKPIVVYVPPPKIEVIVPAPRIEVNVPAPRVEVNVPAPRIEVNVPTPRVDVRVEPIRVKPVVIDVPRPRVEPVDIRFGDDEDRDFQF